jgi:hypothetical protein
MQPQLHSPPPCPRGDAGPSPCRQQPALVLTRVLTQQRWRDPNNAGRARSPGSPKASDWHPMQQPSFTRADSAALSRAAPSSASTSGRWQILWREGDLPQQLTFEASTET